MSLKTKTLEAFFRDFLTALPREPRVDGSAYGLILGAGASRSAGIPVAGEMIRLLKIIAELAQVQLSPKPHRESELSWLFRTVLQQVPWVNEFSDYEREFIMHCVSRARKEPNVTHLVAFDLACAHVFGPVVTTNFDDLMLGAYWSLPFKNAWVEPHIIYDPLSSSRKQLRVAEGVPVVIKAHGHHTIWGIGIIDRDIKMLVPHVKSILHSLPQPERGYVLVGYSGMWDDGIMETLKDPTLTKGKTIYWFFRGRVPPMNESIKQISHHNDIRFVRIVDSDVLFLRMWQEFHSNEERYNPPLFESVDLFSAPKCWWDRLCMVDRSAPDWWDPGILTIDRSFLRNHPRLVELRKELVPLLKKIEQWDDACMVCDCVPRALKRKAIDVGYPDSDRVDADPPEVAKLSEVIPVGIRWTRRNRKLLSLALSRHVDPMMPFTIMNTLKKWDAFVPGS